MFGTRNFASLAAVALVSLVPVHSAWAQRVVEKGKQPKQATTDLVWPLPPEKARFRFVQEIHGAVEIEPLRKSGMLQRLAGVKRREFKPSFVKPFGISSDSKGRVYVTDNGQAMVFVLDRAQHQVAYLGLDGNPRLQMPMGIHVDAKDRVWLADAGAKRVYAFDAQLTLRAALGKQGELVNPVGLATDLARQRLYVADSKQHCILVYDTETGLLVKKFGRRGSGDGEFNFPTDVAIGANGRIYVADTMNRRVQIFDTDFRFVDKFGREGLSWGEFRKPKGIALDAYGNVYVLDSDFCNFQVFDQKKRLLMFLGEFGEAPGQFIVPVRIQIDRQNLIYIVDQMNGRIQIFQLLDGTTEEDVAGTAASVVQR
jgi:DNA-binding beta-propeller fold protein YncE